MWGLGAAGALIAIAWVGVRSSAGTGSTSLGGVPSGEQATRSAQSSSQPSGGGSGNVSSLPMVDDGSNALWSPDYVILRGVTESGGGAVITYDRLQPVGVTKIRACKLVPYAGGSDLAHPGRYCLFNESLNNREVGVLPDALLYAPGQPPVSATSAALAGFIDATTQTPSSKTRVMRLHYDRDNRVDAVFVV